MNTPLSRALARVIAARYERQSTSLLVSLCGWADTGKSTLARHTCEELSRLGLEAAAISTDAFMKDRAERNALGLTGYDPRSVNLNALRAAISKFSDSQCFAYHPYDNRSGTKQEQPSIVQPCNALIVEGIHSFHPDVAGLMELKVFIDSDEDTLRHMRRRANVLKRGMSERDAGVRIQGEWRDYIAYLRPLSASADLIVQVGRDYSYQWRNEPDPPRQGDA